MAPRQDLLPRRCCALSARGAVPTEATGSSRPGVVRTGEADQQALCPDCLEGGDPVDDRARISRPGRTMADSSMSASARPRLRTLAQPLPQSCELVRVRSRVVPVIGEAADQRERAPLALSPDDDGRVRCCCAFGSHQASRSRYERPRRWWCSVRSELMTGERLFEPVEALGQRAQLDAVGLALRLEPTGAEAQLEATARRGCRPSLPCWPAPQGAGRASR